MPGEQVRQAHRGCLVGDPERVPEVFDREVPVLLGLRQESDGRRLGHERARGEVVDLEALLEEVGVVGGALMAQQPVGHGLQRHRPEPMAAGDRRGRQVDPSVLEVGDRPGRVRKIVHIQQLEAELLGHDAHGAVRQSARYVARGLELLLRQLLDVAEVVVSIAHPQPQLGVRAARLLGRRDRLALATLEFTVKPEDRLDRVVRDAFGDLHGRDAELAEDRARLGALQLDLQCRSPVRRLRREQVGHLDTGRGRDRLEQRQLWLALAVLDEAQLTARDAHELAQFVEREATRDPLMADAVAERGQLK